MKKTLNSINEKYHQFKFDQAIQEFYLHDTKLEQSQTGLAPLIFRVLAFLCGYSYIWLLSTKVIFSLLTGCLAFLLVHFIIKYFEKQEYLEKKDNKRYQLARDYIINKILKNHPEWFPGFLVEELKKIEDFSEVRTNPDYKQEADIPILANYKGEAVGIGCNHDEENLVDSRKIKQFFGALVRRGYERGFYISTSNFREEGKKFVRGIKDQCLIKLIDQDGLIEIIKLAKDWPTEKEIDNLVNIEVDKLITNKQKARKDVLNTSKVVNYLFYGLVLISYTWVFQTKFQYLYYSCAGLLFFMASLSIILRPNKDINHKANSNKLFD